MAIYRNVQMSFWTDPNISDDYTPKDKLFYLYVLTNTHTNLCGCYEVSIRQMAYEIGYTNKEIEELIDRAEHEHKTIVYSNTTKELLILHWSKYNWTESDKFRTTLGKEIQKIKNPDFKTYLTNIFNGIDTVYENSDTVSEKTDTVSDQIGYGIQHDYTDTDTDTDTVTVTVADRVSDPVTVTVGNIVDYLNSKCGTNYKANSENTKKHIKARLAEGFTEENFYTVIDKKYDEWHGTEQEKYLRPETLFGSKFEGYLNQKINSPPKVRAKPDRYEEVDQWASAISQRS